MAGMLVLTLVRVCSQRMLRMLPTMAVCVLTTMAGCRGAVGAAMDQRLRPKVPLLLSYAPPTQSPVLTSRIAAGASILGRCALS
eukprot:3676344-Rhodomonas_salina.3